MAKALPCASLGVMSEVEPEVSERIYLAMGYGLVKNRAVRVDVLELARARVQAGISLRTLAQVLGCQDAEARFLLHAFRPGQAANARMKNVLSRS